MRGRGDGLAKLDLVSRDPRDSGLLTFSERLDHPPLPSCYPAATQLLPSCYPAATQLLPSCYPAATQRSTDQQPTIVSTLVHHLIPPSVVMAMMSIAEAAELFTVEPVAAHPLIGHADSDALVQFPKFDTINKSMVLTKARAIA